MSPSSGGASAQVFFGIGAVADIPQIQAEMGKVGSVMKQNPIELGVNMTGLDLGTNSAEAKTFFDQIQAGATNVEKLTVISKEFRDTAGNTFMVPVAALQKFKGGIGAAADSTKLLNQAMIEGKKATSGWIETGNLGKSVLDLGAAGRQTAKEFNTVAKTFDSTEKSVDRFLAKSNNMAGKQVENARKVGLAIKAEKVEFDRLYRAQDWDNAARSADKIRTLTTEFNNLKSATAAGANVFQSWGERMSNAIKQTISYGLSINMVQKAQQLLNDAVRYSIDLNTEMTKIQVLQSEGAKTPEEINALAQSFNDLGQEMGASTLEIAKGSVEWFRQGRTVAETQELMRASMMLSKLGAMESADATNYLTSITNAFKIEVSDTASVVDKLIAVDNIAATSAGELATALRYTSETAALAGVSLEQLVSYIGTVSTVTRQNAEMIGQAFKTMFSRMTLIQGGGTDEEGWTISKVQKALDKVGISMKEADGTFRNMGDVLEDTAAKWDTLGEREQIEIAVAIGGVRQKEAFLVLMDNMDKALTYQAAQTDAAGLAMNRYGIYLESIQAKQGKLTASLQEFYGTVVNGKIVSAFYDIAIGLMNAVNNSELLVPLLVTILGLLIAINRVKIQNYLSELFSPLISGAKGAIPILANLKATVSLMGMAFTGAGGGVGGLSAAIAVIPTLFNPATLAIVAVTAAIAGGIYLWKRHQKAVEDAEKAVEVYIDRVNSLPSKLQSARDIFKEIEDLLAKKTEQGGFLDPEDAEKLASAYERLRDAAPDLDWKWVEGRPFLDMATDIDVVIGKMTELMYASEAEKEAFATWIKEEQKGYEQTQKNLDIEIEKRKILEGINNIAISAPKGAKEEMINTYVASFTQSWDLLSKAQKSAMGEIIAEYSNWGATAGQAWVQGWDENNGHDQLNESIKIDEENIKEQQDKFIAMFSAGIDTRTGEMKDWLRALVGNAYDTSFVQDLIARVMADANAAVEQIITTKGDTRTEDRYSAQEEARDAARDKALKDYKIQSAAIDKVTKSVLALKKAETSIDKVTAMDSLSEQVAKLNEELELPPDLLRKIQTAIESTDPDKIEDVSKELISWLEKNDELARQFPELAALLQQLGGEAISSLTDITYTLDTAAGSFYVAKENAGQAMNWLAESAFNTAKAVGTTIQITANTGETVVVNSLADIQTLITNGLITEDNAMKELINFLVKYAVNARNIIGTVFKDLAKGFPLPAPISYPSGGGGGGGNPNQAQIDALDEQIRLKQEEIEAIRDAIEAYRDYIDAQKESLKRAKEEADFQEELAKKHKDLGKIKARIAILSLDNSEEAIKEREELESEAAEMELDIAEDVEDRKYDLMIQALDDMADAFEASQQLLIDALEAQIEEWKKLRDELSEVGNTGGGMLGTLSTGMTNFSEAVQIAAVDIMARYGDILGKMGLTKDKILEMIQEQVNMGLSVEAAKLVVERAVGAMIARYQALRDAINEANNAGQGPYRPQIDNDIYIPGQVPPAHHAPIANHYGGLVEEHHDGNFAGNLMTNEVFAKLLKGEYVATEGQMNNFMKSILPKLMTIGGAGISPTRLPAAPPKTGDINFNIKIDVQGSLDKAAIPELEKRFVKAVNKALEIKGIRRTAGNFTI